jgi:hypothetical protein
MVNIFLKAMSGSINGSRLPTLSCMEVLCSSLELLLQRVGYVMSNPGANKKKVPLESVV